MKATFALMVVATALALFVMYDQEVGRPAREAKHEAELLVMPLKDQKLDEITVMNGAEIFHFQCQTKGGCEANGSGDWNITAPVKDKADDSVVGSLAASLKSLSRVDTLSFDQGSPDPHEFGFPETALSVQVKAGKNDYTLTLGKPVPVGANVYAMVSQDPHSVVLLDKSFPSLLKQNLFHWRNKRLFPGARPENITQLTWSFPEALPAGHKISAEKKESDWNLRAPINAPANDIFLDGLASVAAMAEGKAVFAARGTPEAKKVLATKPMLDVDFIQSKGEPGHLALYAKPGAKTPGEYVADAKGAENLMTVDATPYKRFQDNVAIYRNHKLFPNEDITQADRMELTFPRADNQTLVFRRKDGQWVQESGPKAPEPYSQKRLNDFFQALGESEAQDFVPSSDVRVAKFHNEPMDLVVKIGDKHPVSARFLLSEHQFAITDGVIPKEVRRFGTEFLKVLPIRVQDLYESSNHRLVTKESNGNDAAPGNAPAPAKK